MGNKEDAAKDFPPPPKPLPRDDGPRCTRCGSPMCDGKCLSGQ